MYCKWLKALFKKSQYAHNSTPIDWHSPVIHLFHVSVAHPWTSPVEDAFSRQELTVLGVGHHPSQMHRKITAQSFATIVITSMHSSPQGLELSGIKDLGELPLGLIILKGVLNTHGVEKLCNFHQYIGNN